MRTLTMHYMAKSVWTSEHYTHLHLLVSVFAHQGMNLALFPLVMSSADVEC